MPTLWCMIQGDPNIFSVDLSRDANTNDLRKAIEGERKLGLLKGIGLEIWKVFLSISAGCGLLPYIFAPG
jgi:Crinkler effector protein N-terminal domain